MTTTIDHKHEHGYEYVLNSDLLGVVTEYMDLTEEQFYELFPKAYARHMQHYDPETKTIYGLKHNIDDNDPFVTISGDYTTVGDYTTLKWYRHGLLHRNNKPAVIVFYNLPAGGILRDSIKYEYYRHGRIHRLDGPAFASSYSNQYYIYGLQVNPPWDLDGYTVEVKTDCIPRQYEKRLMNRYCNSAYVYQPIKDTCGYIEDSPKTDYKEWAEYCMKYFARNIGFFYHKKDSEVKVDCETVVQLYKMERPFDRPVA